MRSDNCWLDKAEVLAVCRAHSKSGSTFSTADGLEERTYLTLAFPSAHLVEPHDMGAAKGETTGSGFPVRMGGRDFRASLAAWFASAKKFVSEGGYNFEERIAVEVVELLC
jgi:hypothetical protein